MVFSFDNENHDAILCTICLRRILLWGEFSGGLVRAGAYGYLLVTLL